MAAFEFFGVDWGTSSFRAWLCRPGEKPVQIRRSDRGMSRLERSEFAPYLEEILRKESISTSVPVIICGMAGARDGWREVPYVSVPAGSADIARNAAQVEAGPYDCTILPGVCIADEKRFDVLRGEETLLFGALANGARDGTFCLPGTHSKWCRIEDARLVNWQTVMTGELFTLLSTASTLSKFCGGVNARYHTTPVFEAAVREALNEPASAIHKLFSIRARALLDPDAEGEDFSQRLSGLLIGHEIAGINLDKSVPVFLVASGAIRDAYSSALSIAGVDFVSIEADTSAQAGLSHFAGELLASNARGSQHLKQIGDPDA